VIPYLVGGLGAAVGVIAALWYKWKLARLEGDYKLLKKDHKNLNATYEQFDKASTEAVGRLREERETLMEQRDKALEELHRCREASGDPVSILDDLNLGGVPLG